MGSRSQATWYSGTVSSHTFSTVTHLMPVKVILNIKTYLIVNNKCVIQNGQILKMRKFKFPLCKESIYFFLFRDSLSYHPLAGTSGILLLLNEDN